VQFLLHCLIAGWSSSLDISVLVLFHCELYTSFLIRIGSFAFAQTRVFHTRVFNYAKQQGIHSSV